MAAIVGKRGTQQESPDSPKLPARTKSVAPFMYMYHPHRWQYVVDTGEWLPLLGKLKLDPGVGGGNDSRGTDLAVAQRTRQGWQIIRPSDERLGKFRWYVQKIPKQGKGSVHCDVTESVEVVGGRAFWNEGGEAGRKFLRYIIETGIVPPINDRIRKLKIEQQRQVVDRLSSAVASSPHNQVLIARLDQANAMLLGMEAPTAKPKQGKATKTKAST